MPVEEQGRSGLGRYSSDLRNVVGSSASAYGYTLTIWSTGMTLSYAYGPPSPPLVFSFFLGAVIGFAVVGVLAFGGVTVEFRAESNRVQLWGSFRFLSVGLAAGAAWFLSAHAPSLPGWPSGAFVATITYLVVVGAENSVADRRTQDEG
jgi:hypothetical protein